MELNVEVLKQIKPIVLAALCKAQLRLYNLGADVCGNRSWGSDSVAKGTSLTNRRT